MVRKPSTQFEPSIQTPTEQIKRVNLTGLTDDDLFGPAFLYEEPEIFTEKKSIPTNPVQIGHGYPVDGYYDVQIDHGYPVDDFYEETYDDEDIPVAGNCFDCGELLYGDEEHNHMDEPQNYGKEEYPTYKPPKTEASTNSLSKEEATRIERKFTEINNAMNNLSSTAMNNFRELKNNLKAMGEKVSEIDDSTAVILPKVKEAVETTDAELTERIEAQQEITDQLREEIAVLLAPEVKNLKEEMQSINSFKEQLTEVQNINTGNMKFLKDKMEDLSERKLELEERIEVIEKDKMIMEKQEITQRDWNQHEEIKFDTEEDDRALLEEVDIEIKMETPSAPEEETEDLITDEESDVEEDLEEEEDLEYEQVREHNKNVVLSWYAKCAEVGLILKEFETIPETGNEIKDPEIKKT